MSRLAIALASTLAATAAHAQNSGSGLPQNPTVGGEDRTRPFLFDARLPGNGIRERTHGPNHHPGVGTIVMPPKASQPERR